jgi:hypothetical protein
MGPTRSSLRRAYERRRETMKPSHVNPGTTETLGADAERDRLTRRIADQRRDALPPA